MNIDRLREMFRGRSNVTNSKKEGDNEVWNTTIYQDGVRQIDRFIEGRKPKERVNIAGVPSGSEEGNEDHVALERYLMQRVGDLNLLGSYPKTLDELRKMPVKEPFTIELYFSTSQPGVNLAIEFTGNPDHSNKPQINYILYRGKF